MVKKKKVKLDKLKGAKLSLDLPGGVPGTRMFEVQKCQHMTIYHIAALRVCPLAADIIRDLYPGLYTDMGGPTVCTLMKGVDPKTTEH